MIHCKFPKRRVKVSTVALRRWITLSPVAPSSPEGELAARVSLHQIPKFDKLPLNNIFEAIKITINGKFGST